MWDNQLSMLQTAVKLDIRDHGMVGRWEHAYQDGGVEALAPHPKGQFKPMATPASEPDRPPDDDKRTRKQLLDEIQQLRMELAYTKKLQALVQARQQQVPQKKRK
jgi:transposase